MKIGFTGTQTRMDGNQQMQLFDILMDMKEGQSELGEFIKEELEFHHGDCIGADKKFHYMVCMAGFTDNIIQHPPINSMKRAYCEGGKILPPKDYLVRNHDIVDACDILIAAPKSNIMELRSGTWATVRYARKVGKKVIILQRKEGVKYDS